MFDVNFTDMNKKTVLRPAERCTHTLGNTHGGLPCRRANDCHLFLDRGFRREWTPEEEAVRLDAESQITYQCLAACARLWRQPGLFSMTHMRLEQG